MGSEAPSPDRKPLILCVDDDAAVLGALRRMLRHEPYEVITAPGAAEGLALLQSRPVAVVISDERMPETSGCDFLADVRKRWPTIRRVILTGRPGNTVVVRGFEAGIDFLFHKPWDDRALKEAIRRLISGTESLPDAGPRVDPPAAEDGGQS